MAIKIYGHSDDCVEVENTATGEKDEFNPPNDGAVELTLKADDTPRSPGVRVVAAYAPDKASGATWRFGIEPLEEGVPMPWHIEVKPEHEYSLAVIVDCPADVKLEARDIDKHGNIKETEVEEEE